MSAAKRSQSAASSTAPPGTDILNDARVLRHELRHVKIRLRESTTTVDELSQLNEEHTRELQQQRVYCKRLEERWAEMENGLQALAQALPIKLPSAASAASASASSSSSAVSALAASSNPVLSLLAARWTALTGSDAETMGASIKIEPKSEGGGAGGGGGRIKEEEMCDDNAAAAAAAAGDEEDEEDEEARKSRGSHSSEGVKLEAALQTLLQQRAAFTHSLLATLVANLSPSSAAAAKPAQPVPPSDLSAQVIALQSERVNLQTRLHSAENEVQLLSATLSEREARCEAEKEKNKALLRRVERMKVDMDNGAVAAARNAANSAAAGFGDSESKEGGGARRGGMEGADSIMLDSVPDTRPLSPTSLARLSVPPAAAAGGSSSSSSSSANRYSNNDFRELKEQLLEFKQLAKQRLDELAAASKEKGQLELKAQKAHLEVLGDDKSIKGTKIFKQLLMAYNDCKAARTKANVKAQMLEQQVAELTATVTAIRAEHEQQLNDAQRQFDEENARYESSLEQLKAINQQLEQHNSELATALPMHPDYTFFASLRSELLPHMEQTLKTQAASIAQREQEKKLCEAAAAGAVEAESSKQVLSRVLRVWKEQERKLEAEKVALQEEVARLRAAPSSSSSSSSSSASAAAAAAAESSDLRVRLSAAQHESAALRAELSALQSASTDVAGMQAELETLRESMEVFSNELNEASTAVDTATTTAAKLSANIFESTRIVDKLRGEKNVYRTQAAAARVEFGVTKTKVEALETTLAAQARAFKDARASIDAQAKEQAKTREVQAALQNALEAAQDTATKCQQETAEAKMALQQLTNQQALSENIIQDLKSKQHQASLAATKADEANRLLKDRLSRLKQESGSSGGSSSSSSSRKSDGHASGDASRIQSLQLLVNCKICETHQKDRVITKCMHTLCQYCVKANLDSRLRKCPTCGLKFGENDVRPLFL